ncbi:phage holin family protein [Streptomyces sp. MST-110588]|uniref:phage holin family protein n=1 Tax=Streptomyces sp. MST-110588 TaxID=2833628 RepID=UPI001F5D5C4D|nr:phage holin family protein [Streptomyces sp. MST-110588]UNO39871.1 phage holin family protein [Streptomyces sp. MST-110588]
MSTSMDHRPARQDHRPVNELIAQASDQMAHLVRDEMALARMEMTRKGKRFGLGGGLLGGAGAVAFLAAQTLVATAVLALALVLSPWAAGLVVAAALLVLAGTLALLGRQRIRRAVPPVPEETLRGVRRDIEEIKGRARR